MGMPRVRLFHWRAEEAQTLVAALRAGGYTVDYPSDRADGSFRKLREGPLPAAIVIDLTRLPSHGRHVAAEIRATKSIRHIPIVFVDGDPEKSSVSGRIFRMLYTSRSRLVSALKRVKPLADPVAPPRMMDRTDRTTAEKLGIKAGGRVALIDPPADYLRVLGKLPKDASVEEEPEETLPLTLWFVRDPDGYAAALPDMRRRATKTRIWVIYPKGRPASGLTQGFIREAALSVGLVDYKVCSVNDVWTGLLFTRKK